VQFSVGRGLNFTFAVLPNDRVSAVILMCSLQPLRSAAGGVMLLVLSRRHSYKESLTVIDQREAVMVRNLPGVAIQACAILGV